MTDQEKFEKILDDVFEALYLAADAILIQDKPCEHEVTAMGHTCLGKDHKRGGNKRPQCCCSGCHFFKNGCTAEKPLTCKCWLCPIAKDKYPDTHKNLWYIDNLVLAFYFWIPRGSKSESIQNAKVRLCYSFQAHDFDYAKGLQKLIKLIEKYGLNINTNLS